MLYQRAEQRLAERLGPPAQRELTPRRKCAWSVQRGARGASAFQVTLESLPGEGGAKLWIADPFAPREHRDDVVVLLGEPDIEIALELVRSHERP